MEELYYAHPVQVRYWDAHRQQYMGGIAYHEFLIDGFSGEAKLIVDVLKEAAADKTTDDGVVEWLRPRTLTPQTWVRFPPPPPTNKNTRDVGGNPTRTVCPFVFEPLYDSDGELKILGF